MNRTRGIPVKFQGELIAKGSSLDDDYYRHSRRHYHVVEIYRTRGGKYVGLIYFDPGQTAQDEENFVVVADTMEELRKKLLDYEYANSPSCKIALAEALDDESIAIEEID